jgi:hypothetical protein
MLATTELHRQYHNHSSRFAVTARRLAEFLQSVEAEESLLTQRLRDRENRGIRLAVAGTGNCDTVVEQVVPAQPIQPIGPAVDEGTVSEVYGEF